VTLKTVFSRHPSTAFVLMTLAWSWGIWSFLFTLVGQGGLTKNPPLGAYLIASVGGCGPTVSGLFLTRFIYGRKGMTTLWARLRFVPLDRRWLALLIIPLLTSLTPLLRCAAGYSVDIGAMLRLVIPGLSLGLFAGLAEEFGWRGFLLPHLLKCRSALRSTLIVGLVWGGLWHGYADYFGVSGEGTRFWLLILLLGPGLLTAWSLILTSVYERTEGNLILSILMHASISSSALIFGQRYDTIGEELVWTSAAVGIALLASCIIWLAGPIRGNRASKSA
jgi:uncharacterized protein